MHPTPFNVEHFLAATDKLNRLACRDRASHSMAQLLVSHLRRHAIPPLVDTMQPDMASAPNADQECGS